LDTPNKTKYIKEVNKQTQTNYIYNHQRSKPSKRTNKALNKQHIYINNAPKGTKEPKVSQTKLDKKWKLMIPIDD